MVSVIKCKLDYSSKINHGSGGCVFIKKEVHRTIMRRSTALTRSNSPKSAKCSLWHCALIGNSFLLYGAVPSEFELVYTIHHILFSKHNNF